MRHILLTRPDTVSRLPDLFDMRRWFDTLPNWMSGPFEGLRLEEEVVGDEYIVRAEAPGIDPERDCEVWIADGVLHIDVERTCATRDEDDGFRSEFRYGSFHRSVALPDGITAASVQATYTDGVLEVRLPIHASTGTVSKVPISTSRRTDGSDRGTTGATSGAMRAADTTNGERSLAESGGPAVDPEAPDPERLRTLPGENDTAVS